MNVITSYLDGLFSIYPPSPKLLEAKEELSAMMEDAYTAHLAAGKTENEALGQVISDFGNLSELAPVLGISAEIGAPAPLFSTPAGAATISPATSGQSATPPPMAAPPLSLSDATAFASAHRKAAPKLALGVALLVVAPAPAFLSNSLTELKAGLDGDLRTFLSFIPVLIIAAIGIVLLISRARELAQFSDIRTGAFGPNPVVNAWARNEASTHSRARTRALQVAVVLWILALIPLMLYVFFSASEIGIWEKIGLVVAQFMVAAGLFIFLRKNSAESVLRTITNAKQSAGEKKAEAQIELIASIYFPLLTAAYLAWSFIGDAWSRSWILWPIGGVLFAAIAAGLSTWGSLRSTQR